ncbi:lipid A deacylase LpxR family protein [Flavobacterium sp. XN-5]|uniref:lipid A deacylase LpxR family protein n=1 Tax=Flavobacterium sp. XN-5 TaxID=2599390 RepID=UPI00293B8BF3|nr:lipid A deacylase LpxR family protein [Flavobacterium sp. XN-5]
MTKRTYIIFLFMVATFVFGQSRTREIGLITENDLYTSSKNDKYYTNGIELFYRFLLKNTDEKVRKKVIELKMGQYIYNPKFINKGAVAVIDRPFAGYLFGGVGKSLFFQNESVFKGGLVLGVVGNKSFAEETQRSFHKFFKYKPVFGWETQVANSVAVQTHFMFAKKLFVRKESNYVDFNFQSEADLGTVFTGFSAGFLSRIGFEKLVPIYDSNMYGASVSSESRKLEPEFYFYIAPSIRYQVYDATIQGGLINDNSPVTFDLIPIRFNGEAGFKFRKDNLNLSYAFVYRSKELHNKINTGYFYGSILVSYLLK